MVEKKQRAAHRSGAAICYNAIKNFGGKNYSLDSVEIITCFLLSHGGFFVDNINEFENHKVIQDLQKAKTVLVKLIFWLCLRQ